MEDIDLSYIKDRASKSYSKLKDDTRKLVASNKPKDKKPTEEKSTEEKPTDEKCAVDNDTWYMIIYNKFPFTSTLIVIFRIILSIVAFILAWDCNKMSGIFMRIIVSIIAIIFSELYVLYYAIYHSVMGFQCYSLPITSYSASSSSLPPL